MIKKPILIDIPEEIESERLLIRPSRAGDGVALRDAIRSSFPELHRWLPWATGIPTVDESEEYCRQSYAKFVLKEDLPLVVLLKDTKTLIGATGLHRFDWTVPRFEIGYWISSPHVGKGYATETVKTLANFAFTTLKARRVEIHADALNERSCKVAERAGFVLEGVLRNYTVDVLGQLTDKKIYALLR